MMLRRALGACLYVGDRNFGVFRIVQTARARGSHVLVRWTETRARRLRGRPLRPGQHSLRWAATADDQLPLGCKKDPIPGRLRVVSVRRKGDRSQKLYLFTTLTDPGQFPVQERVDLYGLRRHIELNLRYLKSPMRWVQLECKSAERAQKEWLAGLMADNVIRAAMLCAALRQGLRPLRLSFSLSRRHLAHWLALFASGTAGARHGHKLLEWAGRARPPRRRQARPSEPRAQRHPRQPYPPLIGSREKGRQQRKRAQKCTTKN
jgi:hypothetical protein